MRTLVSKETAEFRLVNKYHKLHSSLVELVAALNVLEPGGTLVDDVTFETKEDGRVRVAYVATPVQVTINTPERKFILRVIENPGGKQPMPGRRIEKQARVVPL
jgi:hypothetical protein